MQGKRVTPFPFSVCQWLFYTKNLHSAFCILNLKILPYRSPAVLINLKPDLAVPLGIIPLDHNAQRLRPLCTGDFGGIAAVFGESGIEYYAIGEHPGGVGGADLERR